MVKSFERRLSQILSVLILLLFAITLVAMNVSIWVLSYIWAGLFILSWVFMLILSLYILLEKKPYGLSILTGIVTALSFLLLSVPAILVASRFFPGLPQVLSFGIDLLDNNNQMVLYTSLIAVYFFNLLNSIRLKNKGQDVQELAEKEEIPDPSDNDFPINDSIDKIITNNSSIDEVNQQNISTNSPNSDIIKLENHKISSEDLEIGEKIVFESNNDEKLEYNTEKVIIVEDLTEDDLNPKEGEENNG